MCGIAGCISKKSHREELTDILSKMSASITHRGPDDEGQWIDPELGMGLAHRRLSIIDQSSHGHQPMVSFQGRYVISYNGEIYNFGELRDELESSSLPKSSSPFKWKGHSDTEVILAAIEEWGLEKALQKFIGMFAFALWDRKERVLHLVRDRLGIKPLYYGWQGNSFLFGSELKALKSHPHFQGEVDRKALALMMRFSYIPSPYSTYKGIFKLPSGTVLSVNPEDMNTLSEPIPYWSVKNVAETGVNTPFIKSEQEAVSSLENLLRDSIKLRMISDVPLGAFLSGGIDSSLVVALMQSQSDRPIKTFSIGFHESDFNEADHAKAVATHLGTDHTELYVTSEQAMAVIPRLPAIYDEPFADSSQIPTFLVSEMARKDVTVSLSGDGGDELFGGYKLYTQGPKLWKTIGGLPDWSRSLLKNSFSVISSGMFQENWLGSLLKINGNSKAELIRNKLRKFSEILSARNPEELYFNLRCLSRGDGPSSVLFEGGVVPNPYDNDLYKPKNLNFIQKMMFLDTISFMSDGILTKVDRASMDVSLEARVPLLDHRVVEFAWRLPLNLKIRNGVGKWLLRQVLYKYVPKNLIERPKMGFDLPISAWLRGPLRDWSEELLKEDRLQREGFFDPEIVREKWAEHLSRKYDWSDYLWSVLMFQAWLEHQSR